MNKKSFDVSVPWLSGRSFIQVADSNMRYQSRLEELEKLVKDYEGKFSQHQEVLDSTIQKDKVQIDRLQEEKAMLEVSGEGG